ncbi:hypothetical protein [Saccharopolyspora flava]|nr:hypothetical protein [Saccharopolyspora flava]
MSYKGEQLPMPKEKLEELAEYYETHSGADEPGAEDGSWVEAPNMVTVSIRVTEQTRNALDIQAKQLGMRRTAYIRHILEDATREQEARESLETRVTRLEAALARLLA